MQLLDKGGFVAAPLVGCALALWYAVGYRALSLRRGSTQPVAKLIERARQGQRLGGALGRGIQRAVKSRPTPRGLDVALGDAEAELGRFSSVITAVVTIAPLLGLLGTVSGMIETFDALGEMTLFSQSGGIAGGVSEALFSTQLGLTVAIPGLVAGRMLQRRQETRVEEFGQVRAALLEVA